MCNNSTPHARVPFIQLGSVFKLFSVAVNRSSQVTVMHLFGAMLLLLSTLTLGFVTHTNSTEPRFTAVTPADLNTLANSYVVPEFKEPLPLKSCRSVVRVTPCPFEESQLAGWDDLERDVFDKDMLTPPTGAVLTPRRQGLLLIAVSYSNVLHTPHLRPPIAA